MFKAKSALTPLALALYLQNKQKKENECGGILAYISQSSKQESTAKQFNSITFTQKFADYLRKQPYYQCGFALNDINSESVKTQKFLSMGTLQKEANDVEEVKAASEEKHGSSDDEDRIQEQMKNIDYGYKELAAIQAEDDCFHKLNEHLGSDEVYSKIDSNMCIVHSRFAEVRRYYQSDTLIEDLSAIPLDHAHPNIDSDNKIALFHNGFISNFNELKQEISDAKEAVRCGKDLATMTDS